MMWQPCRSRLTRSLRQGVTKPIERSPMEENIGAAFGLPGAKALFERPGVSGLTRPRWSRRLLMYRREAASLRCSCTTSRE